MFGPANESVGFQFQTDLLQLARNKTLEVIVRSSRLIHPGMTEIEAGRIVQQIQSELGAPKSWHPPQIRFGENTLLPFGARGKEGVKLADNDIYFIDIGPIFSGHEGDVGRPFVVGNHPDMKRCCEDAEKIWHEVRDHWLHNRVSGKALYQFAHKCCEIRGWILSLQKANGHRIADFPHAARIRGSIEGFEQIPAADRWILEIQIRHPTEPYGAFFEDLLN